MIELVVFDMAGTTVEEGGAVYRAIADAVAARIGRAVPDDLLARWTGAEKREAIAGLIGDLGGTADEATLDEVFADFSARLDGAYLARPPAPIPGSTDLFELLHRRGIAVALTTGFTTRVAERILARLDWARGVEFDVLVTAEQVGAGRPSPLMIQRAAELTGVHDPSAVMVVGDTVRDLEAGRNAGAGAVVGVLTGAQGEAELSAVPGAVVVAGCAAVARIIDAPPDAVSGSDMATVETDPVGTRRDGTGAAGSGPAGHDAQ